MFTPHKQNESIIKFHYRETALLQFRTVVCYFPKKVISANGAGSISISLIVSLSDGNSKLAHFFEWKLNLTVSIYVSNKIQTVTLSTSMLFEHEAALGFFLAGAIMSSFTVWCDCLTDP